LRQNATNGHPRRMSRTFGDRTAFLLFLVRARRSQNDSRAADNSSHCCAPETGKRRCASALDHVDSRSSEATAEGPRVQAPIEALVRLQRAYDGASLSMLHQGASS
jgi:hypothetical protein